MSNARKLQTEIDRVMKKVDEGVELFNEIWEKVYEAETQNQKEKYEVDLKKEIKKLQRLRDQIKTWISSSDVKDKEPLLDARKLIETKMEQFKICEKETKTKTYSKEGLARAEKLDPAEVAKQTTTKWLGEYIDKLQQQVEEKDFEIEKLSTGKGKKTNKHAIETLQVHNTNHRFHISKLEGIIRLVNNDRIDVEPVDALKDDLDYYLESYEDEDYAQAYDEEFFYESLGLEDMDVVNVDRVTLPEAVAETTTTGKGRGKKGGGSGSETGDAASSSSRGSKDNKGGRKSSLSSVIPLTIGRARASVKEAKAEKKLLAQMEAASNASVDSTDATGGGGGKGTPGKVGRAGSSVSNASSTTSSSNNAAAPAAVTQVTPAPPPHTTQGTSMAAILKRETEQQQEKERQKLLREQQARAQAEQLRQQQAQQEALKRQQQQEAALRQQQQQQQAQQEAALKQQQAAQLQAQQRQQAAQQEAAAKQQQQAAAQLQAQQRQQQAAAAEQQAAQQQAANTNAIELLTSGLGGLGLGTTTTGVVGEGKNDAAAPSSTASATGVLGGSMAELSAAGSAGSASGTAIAQTAGAGGASSGSSSYLSALNDSFATAPNTGDSDRSRQYTPQNPYPSTPASFPTTPNAIFDNPAVFSKLGTDCLFFIFYYAQGTYQQYLAARELKKQSWRFHKKYMTWFQRHEEPKITTDEYEQGTYVYFDYETGWCTRIKADFRFEYCFLEDSLQ